MIPGWGEKKVKDWCNAVRENFRVRKAAKAGVGLRRNESSMGGIEDGDNSTPSSRQTPIPIGMVPSRENSGLGTSRKGATREPAPKRRRFEEIVSADADSDEEAAMIAAAEGVSVAQPDVAQRNALKGQESMSEGVAAALAKLRKSV